VTGPGIAMSAQVTPALISSGAALAVALLGIAGAIVGQFVATKRGFANSLALLERQQAQSLALAEQERADRERERREQLRREDAYRYSEQRRSVYASFLRSVRETRDANWRVWNDNPPEGESEQEKRERRERVITHAYECSDRLGELEAELEVIASNAVYAAARKLMHTLPRGGEEGYLPAMEAFRLAVRRELGVAESPP
jgi:hypothetical protein